jgi:hypothetical protein
VYWTILLACISPLKTNTLAAAPTRYADFLMMPRGSPKTFDGPIALLLSLQCRIIFPRSTLRPDQAAAVAAWRRGE